ncbi:peptide synthetase, partial [Streptomyces sp. SID7760]|nr:peptide synthetase [Streptomyces sp. SID7760]
VLRSRIEETGQGGDEGAFTARAVPGPASLFTPEFTDLSELGGQAAEERALDLAAHDAALPFDLTAAGPLRARLVRIAAREHLLVIVAHHIAFDGWSVGVFWREFFAAYRARTVEGAEPLPELALSYREFASWQRERLGDDALADTLGYWRDRLGGLAPLDLPTDRPRPATPSGRGEQFSFELPEPLLRQLRDLGRRHDATLFMVLLAGFQALLARWSGGEDIA